MIQASGGLSESDIEKMVKDAEAHASEDKERRELVEVRNHAEALIHTTEKTLTEHGEKISESDREKVTEAVKDLREALDSPEKSLIQQKMEPVGVGIQQFGSQVLKSSHYGNTFGYEFGSLLRG